MSEAKRGTELLYTDPIFIVANLARSVSFYQQYLGFEVRYLAPAEEPFFAVIGRDSVSLHLKEVDPSVPPQPNAGRHEYAPWDVFVGVRDPEALAAEFSASGLTLHVGLTDRGDALRGFQVRDADGYVLFFGHVRE